MNIINKTQIDQQNNNNDVDVQNNNWFVNISNTDVPADIAEIAGLSPKFSVPGKINKHDVTETIKNVENAFYITAKEIFNDTNTKQLTKLEEINAIQDIYNKDPNICKQRHKIINCLNMTKNNNIHRSSTSKAFDKKINKFNIFMKNNNNIIFTSVDKGNTTLCMGKRMYVRSAQVLLTNQEVYKVVKNTKTLLINLQKKFSDTLKAWKEQGYLKPGQDPYLFTLSHTSIPAIYFPPKLHKIDNIKNLQPDSIIPVRPVNPNYNSYSNIVAKTLLYHISPCIPKPKSNVKNSFDLINKIKGKKVPYDYKILSLDVNSLYTNVPLELVISSLDKRYHLLHNKCKMPYDEIIETIKLLYNNTYCTFNHVIYKQLEGTPMGSAISSLLADIVMEDLEIECINKLDYAPLFYYRYVDDVILAIPQNKIDYTLNIFNSYHKKLQFTIELEEDDQINFLDIKIIKDQDNNIITNWYQKKTFSGRILNYDSNHPTHQKIAMIYNLIDRALILSDKKFHKDNIRLVQNILIANNYPQHFIHKYINKRKNLLQHCDFNLSNIKKSINSQHSNKVFIKIPFKYGIYNKIKKVLNNDKYKTIPLLNKDLSKFIIKGKINHKLNKTGVVYKIKCKDCNCVYIGETKRSLFMRINEHKRDKTSVIATHCNDNNHSFDFKKLYIIDEERGWTKRKISESINIHMHNPTLNVKEDTNNLNVSYIHTINTLKHQR